MITNSEVTNMDDVCVSIYYKVKTTDSWDSLIYFVKEHSVQDLIKPFETMLKREIFVALRIEYTYL